MKQTVLVSSFLLLAQSVMAQGTIQDYKNAFAMRSKVSGKMDGGNLSAHAIEGTHRFWYTNWTQQDGTLYTLIDADNNTSSTLFDKQELAKALTQKCGKEIKANELNLGRISVDKDNVMRFETEGKRWSFNLTTSTLEGGEPLPKWHGGKQRHWMEVPDEKDGQSESPDGDLVIFTRNNNLWTKHRKSKVGASPLTQNGDSTYYYSSWGSFSPDGKYYATVRIKPAPKRYVYYVESSPQGQLQPILHKQEYAKPGDSLNYRVPVIVNVETGKVIEPSTELFQSQYNVTAPRWDSNSRTVTFEFNERGHHHYRVLELSALTGKVRTLIEEKNDKYINYGRQYRYDFEDGRRILWTSERDGYNNIYLYDRIKGKLIRQVTRGGYYVRDIQYVDEKNGIIYFSANGKSGLRESDKRGKNATFAGTNATEEDPYLIHFYKIKLNGTGLTCLTPEEGNHHVTYSDDYKYLVDTYSTVLNPPVSVLRSANDGKILRTLAQANITRLQAAGWQAPEVFVAKGRDGKTDMWGLIRRPSNFDPNKKYPIIEYIYSGPGDQYVPKDFTPWLWTMDDLAELGFVVVQLDAMTTSFRSRSFEEVCYKNLKDAGFPDRIEWIKAAAKKYPYMDADNVGIYGCSAGGQEALGALLFHGDFYKAGYAACGCHDNRMDKIWWNEQWMSYPIDSSYIECSNVENAYKLERPLMIVVGELDDNVDPASTMQVVNALEKAGKDFELIVVPGAHHTMGESYGEHKRYDFFVKNLLGVKPPKWNDLK